ncbi:hypothetical protein QNI19_04320 [Cytophagaceae bacterium DM2B3-1]|uniref:Lipocalin-like domain-containing protein n=1 Tax=Xanthocytophaga flava TaxID=3048013 RepID=A0ABT7CER5_9BACT|nr:hypothetical protein [Xanthocytophaga flavus]MDJ1492143.1 hypothetical protein [Xanthocytophaga flavus]
MKKNFYLLTLFVYFTFSSFKSDTTEQYLIRKWKFDAEATKKTIEKSFEAGSDPEADKFAKGMIDYFLNRLTGSTTEYQQGGILFTTLVDDQATKTIKGSWRIDKNTNELVLIENSTKKREERVKILSISNTRLELGIDGITKKGPLSIIYIATE